MGDGELQPTTKQAKPSVVGQLRSGNGDGDGVVDRGEDCGMSENDTRR